MLSTFGEWMDAEGLTVEDLKLIGIDPDTIRVLRTAGNYTFPEMALRLQAELNMPDDILKSIARPLTANCYGLGLHSVNFREDWTTAEIGPKSRKRSMDQRAHLSVAQRIAQAKLRIARIQKSRAEARRVIDLRDKGWAWKEILQDMKIKRVDVFLAKLNKFLVKYSGTPSDIILFDEVKKTLQFRSPPMSPAQKEMVMEMHRNGRSTKEIADYFQKSPATISGIIKRIKASERGENA